VQSRFQNASKTRAHIPTTLQMRECVRKLHVQYRFSSTYDMQQGHLGQREDANLPASASQGAFVAVNPGAQKPWGTTAPSAVADPSSQLLPAAQEHGALSACSPAQKKPASQG